MALNYGKKFESIFKNNWIESFPNGFIYRLNDQMSGYRTVSANICDYICFNNNLLYLIEVKSHAGNTFPLANLTQYDKLVTKSGIPGVRAGVIIWFYEKDIDIVYVPVSTFKKLKDDGKKSFNIKMIGDQTYPSVVCPGQKKRLYVDTDYSILSTLPEGW